MSVSQNYKTISFETRELEELTAALFVRVRDLQKMIDDLDAAKPVGVPFNLLAYRNHLAEMRDASGRALAKVTQ